MVVEIPELCCAVVSQVEKGSIIRRPYLLRILLNTRYVLYGR